MTNHPDASTVHGFWTSTDPDQHDAHVATVAEARVLRNVAERNEETCARNPVRADRPFRAWNKSKFFSGNFDFATMGEAVAYLREQATRQGVSGSGLDPFASFIQTRDGAITLAEPGIAAPGRTGIFGEWRILPEMGVLSDADRARLRAFEGSVDAIAETIREASAEGAPDAVIREMIATQDAIRAQANRFLASRGFVVL